MVILALVITGWSLAYQAAMFAVGHDVIRASHALVVNGMAILNAGLHMSSFYGCRTASLHVTVSMASRHSIAIGGDIDRHCRCSYAITGGGANTICYAIYEVMSPYRPEDTDEVTVNA